METLIGVGALGGLALGLALIHAVLDGIVNRRRRRRQRALEEALEASFDGFVATTTDHAEGFRGSLTVDLDLSGPTLSAVARAPRIGASWRSVLEGVEGGGEALAGLSDVGVAIGDDEAFRWHQERVRQVGELCAGLTRALDAVDRVVAYREHVPGWLLSRVCEAGDVDALRALLQWFPERGEVALAARAAAPSLGDLELVLALERYLGAELAPHLERSIAAGLPWRDERRVLDVLARLDPAGHGARVRARSAGVRAEAHRWVVEEARRHRLDDLLPFVEEQLDAEDAAVVVAAASALRELGATGSIPRVLSRFGAAPRAVRVALAETVGALGEPAHGVELRGAANDDEVVALAVAAAVGRIRERHGLSAGGLSLAAAPLSGGLSVVPDGASAPTDER